MSDDAGNAGQGVTQPKAQPTEGLAHFLQVWAAAKDRSPDAHRVERLSLFLRQAKPLLPRARVRTASTEPPRLSRDRLQRVVAALAAPLRAGLARGDFIDVWAVAGLGRNEIRNAGVLAWLLNPRGSHGQGTSILKAFMDRIARTLPEWKLELSELAGALVQTEHRPLGSDRDRVDLTVETAGTLIFIEIKIDAPEGERQLARYKEAVDAKANALRSTRGALRTLVIFLSPRRPADPVAGVVQLGWRDVEKALIASSACAPATSQAIIRSFAAHVKKFRGEADAMD